jgi:nucleoside-diphosphate-sugar epimerase
MNVLITGAAGNLGGFLSQQMIGGEYHLKLLVHERPLPDALAEHPDTTVIRADLALPETLQQPCEDTDCIVHFAGRLFAPRPASFLPETNIVYVKNLVSSALDAGVRKFILISFPHVEGESNPQEPARGVLAGSPESVHARTRLEAEKHLFAASEGSEMVPVALRSGMIYGQGVLMIEAARWLMARRLLGVWRRDTWIHLISLPDFLSATLAAIEVEDAMGIYNLGDRSPLTLQAFLDRIADHWGYKRPWRVPEWVLYMAAWFTEAFGFIFGSPAPLTRDFIKIGMASYVMDTSRMEAELLPHMHYPTLDEGIELL